MVIQLSPKDSIRLKKEYLVEIEDLASDKGIWLEMNILYTGGAKTV